MIIIRVHITKHLYAGDRSLPGVVVVWHSERRRWNSCSELPATPDRSCDPKAAILASGPIMEQGGTIPREGQTTRSAGPWVHEHYWVSVPSETAGVVKEVQWHRAWHLPVGRAGACV